MAIITRDEATTVGRSECGVVQWPQLVCVMTSNCLDVHPQIVMSGIRASDGHNLIDALAVRFLETLYDAGYVVAKLADPDGVAPADRPWEVAERILELASEGVDCSASAVELAGWVLTSSVVVGRQERDLRRADASREMAASEEGA